MTACGCCMMVSNANAASSTSTVESEEVSYHVGSWNGMRL